MKEHNFLLAHFRRMQKVAMNFLQQPNQENYRNDFVNDMLMALDGPDQREAEAWVNFDYLVESERTMSDKFNGELVHMSHVHDAFANFAAAARELDRIKKLLFYGENSDKRVYRLAPQHAFDNTADAGANELHLAMQEAGLHVAIDKAQDLLHSVLGIASEAGELVEAIEAVLNGGKLDTINLTEEVGDCQWYEAALCRTLGVHFEYIQRNNIAKLKTRFPDKFTTEAANVRNLDAERMTLSNSLAFDEAPDEKLTDAVIDHTGTFEVNYVQVDHATDAPNSTTGGQDFGDPNSPLGLRGFGE